VEKSVLHLHDRRSNVLFDFIVFARDQLLLAMIINSRYHWITEAQPGSSLHVLPRFQPREKRANFICASIHNYITHTHTHTHKQKLFVRRKAHMDIHRKAYILYIIIQYIKDFLSGI